MADAGDVTVPLGRGLRLGRWISSQRALKRKLGRERGEGMTVARAARLDKLGFE